MRGHLVGLARKASCILPGPHFNSCGSRALPFEYSNPSYWPSLWGQLSTTPTASLIRSRAWQHQRVAWKQTATEEYNLIEAEPQLVRIDSYSDTGFVVNGVTVEGPIMCVGDTWTHWAVRSFPEITNDSLALLRLVKPVPDMLVIGCGARLQMIPQDLRKWLASQGVAVDAIDTANAVGLFNILNQEGRSVVAALFPAGN